MHKSVLAGIAVLVIGCSLYALRDPSGPSGPPEAAPPDRAFAGKILVVNLKSDTQTSTVVENPAIRRSGGREFLVGTCVDSGDKDEWREGLTVWTAMDDISQIVEVRDRGDLKKRLEAEPEDSAPPIKGVRQSQMHSHRLTDRLGLPALASR
jgi:hypothetical protein